MAFSKRFPKTVEGSVYPKWIEVTLHDGEEKEVEDKAKEENKKLMRECVDDAYSIVKEKGLNETDVANIAISLFEKRASHAVYWKEKRTKEKFDKEN